MYNDHLRDQYDEAMAIILKSIHSGKQLTQFKLWEHLESEARIQAIKDSFRECFRCYGKKHISKLNEENNPYGTFYECIKTCNWLICHPDLEDRLIPIRQLAENDTITGANPT